MTPRWRSRAATARTRSRSAAPHASPEAAIATAAHDTLVGLPALGLNAAQQTILDGDYAAYMSLIADGRAKDRGIEVGREGRRTLCSPCAPTTASIRTRASPT